MTGKAAPAGYIPSGVDAIGSFTLKQSSHTQRDKTNIDEAGEPKTNNGKLSSTIENKNTTLSHLEVTDRLYNKKLIHKTARMKSSNIKQQIKEKQNKINKLQMEMEKKSVPGIPYSEILDQFNQSSNSNIVSISSRAIHSKAARAIVDRSLN